MRTFEPYEQVKQKIMDAEKVDLSDVVVEHFTRDEYEFLKECMETAISNDEATFTDNALAKNDDYKIVKAINNKLTEILKEDND